MTLLCKNKALYVKACIIQNGVADTYGDVLNSSDIKKIFTSFNNQNNFEINHNDIPIEEVSLLENYISTATENIAGTNVPVGSWNCVIRVDNPSIKEKLLRHEFGGVSLNNRVKEKCVNEKGLEGEVTYADVGEMECIIPLLISFVDEPANQVGLHIMDYTAYIQRSKKFKNTKILKSENMSLLEKLKSIVAEAEAEETSEDETTVEKSDETEEETTDENATANTEEEDETEIEKTEETTVETTEEEDETEIEKSDETEEEATVEKDDETVPVNSEEDRIIALENRIQILEDKINEVLGLQNPIDEEAIPNNSDEPLITKSSKIEITNEPNVEVRNFYEMTNRDPLTGKRIRTKTKILN